MMLDKRILALLFPVLIYPKYITLKRQMID